MAAAAREQRERVAQLEHILEEALAEEGGVTLDAALSIVLASFLQLHPPTRSWFMLRRELQIGALRDARIAALLTRSDNENVVQLAQIVELALARVGRRLFIDQADFVRVIVGVFELSLQTAFEASSDLPAENLAARSVPTLILQLTTEMEPAPGGPQAQPG